MDDNTEATPVDTEEITVDTQQSAYSLSAETDNIEAVKLEVIEQAPAEPEVTAKEVEVEVSVDEVATELNEDLAMEFLAKSKGLTTDEFRESLTPKEQKKYAPEMEKFSEFIEKTGNKNYNDFLETQKDWSGESSDNVLKTFLKLSQPDLSDKEINHLYNKKYNTNDLDEDDDEDEILEKGINVKSDLKRANEFLEQRKKEFNAEGGSDEHIPETYREAKKFYENYIKQEEDNSIERDSNRNDFISKTEDLFNRDFEGFKIKLGDEKMGFEEFSIKPDNLKEVKDFQLDSNNFINEFLDKDTGNIKDLKGYHEAIYMAKNYKSELNKSYMRGIARQLEISDKVSKNIQPDNIRSVPTNESSGITFTSEK
jgi:hypothetical protein